MSCITDKERLIEFIRKVIPYDFMCGHIAVTFNDDGSLFITVANREDEPTFDEWTKGEGR